MKFSKLFTTTYKETPNDAQTPSHQLMHRAGLIQKSGAGLYSYSPLMVRVISKTEALIRRIMNKYGFLEITLPVTTPSELWKESGRWDELGNLMLRSTDRSNREICISPTNEEAVVDYFRKIAKSYKQLPTTLYQINTKFRDEIRPRFGLMRAREFTMKDAYSFHIDKECMDKTYDEFVLCYKEIFDALELDYIVVEADGGAMAGSEAKTHEFQVVAPTGEDDIVVCKQEKYASNVESAITKRSLVSHNKEIKAFEDVKTPNIKTIQDVCQYLSIPEYHSLKVGMFNGIKDNESFSVMALCLGDDEFNEIKVMKALNAQSIEFMESSEILRLGLVEGFMGPVNINSSIQLIIDNEIDINASYVVGANKSDYHLKNMQMSRDVSDFMQFDIRKTKEGDVTLSGNPIEFLKGIEVGHVFQLGDKYTSLLNANVLDKNGKAIHPLMGCYGIGVGRSICAAIEQKCDEKGIQWPVKIAPFQVDVIATTTKSEQIVQAADEIYQEFIANDIDVIFDDRDVSAGFKFKDAELIGFPFSVIVGRSWEERKELEVKNRSTGHIESLKKSDVVSYIKKELCLI